MNNKHDIIAILVLLVVVGILGFILGVSYMRYDAVDKGYAEYNSKTGEWQWKKGGQR